MRRSQRLVLLMFSLWCVYFIRAHQILALPVFVDESLHILRAQVVFDFSDAVASILPGKLLLYYYLSLFAPDNQSGLWVSRQAVALIAPLCAALCCAIVYQFTHSFRAGLITIWLYATAPLMIFFERMALADPFALSFGLGVIWLSLMTARHPTQARKMPTGLLLGFALLAKLTAMPLMAVPLLALGRKSRHLMLIYGVAAVVILLPSTYAVYQQINPPQNKAEVVASTLFIPDERSRPEQITHNAAQFGSALWAFGPSVPVVMVVALLGLAVQPRAGGYLLMILALLWGFLIVVTAFPTTRYLTLGFPLILILVGIAMGHLESGPMLVYSGVLLVLIGFSAWNVRFITAAWADPMRLTLADQDEWEYFRHTSSGYALREAAEQIYRMDDSPLIAGFVGSCHSLRLYGANANDYLYCPLFPFNDNPALSESARWLDQFAERGEAFALVEDVGAATFHEHDYTATLIDEFARPHGGVALRLYRVTP